MNKLLVVFIAIIIVIAVAIVYSGSKGNLFGKKAEATFGETTVALDVADTPESREKGLSGRNSLAEKAGMLFIFDQPGVPSFWMKDMKFPIDIIFVNNDKIVTIYKNVPAPKNGETPSNYYQPTSPTNRVIELKAGMSDKYKLQVGNTVDLSL